MNSPSVAGKLHLSLTRNRTMEKKDDTCLHIAIRTGDLGVAFEIVSSYEQQKLIELLLKKNQSGETAFYVAAEYGCVDLVREMIKYYDSEAASIKAKNGLDAFHIAARQGNLEVLKVLMETHTELSMTFDQTNTTTLHAASEQGQIEVVNFLLEKNSGMFLKSTMALAFNNITRGVICFKCLFLLGASEYSLSFCIFEFGFSTRKLQRGTKAMVIFVRFGQVSSVRGGIWKFIIDLKESIRGGILLLKWSLVLVFGSKMGTPL